MIKPLGAGDVCIVINGLAGDKSPNLGRIVVIDKRVYGEHGLDHREYGPVYSCIGKDLSILTDTGEYQTTTKCDFPGIWLKRIDPTELRKQVNRILETEH